MHMTKGLNLELFVLFSSIAAVLGNTQPGGSSWFERMQIYPPPLTPPGLSADPQKQALTVAMAASSYNMVVKLLSFYVY